MRLLQTSPWNHVSRRSRPLIPATPDRISPGPRNSSRHCNGSLRLNGNDDRWRNSWFHLPIHFIDKTRCWFCVVASSCCHRDSHVRPGCRTHQSRNFLHRHRILTCRLERTSTAERTFAIERTAARRWIGSPSPVSQNDIPLPPSEGPNPAVELRDGDAAISANVNRFHYSMGLQIRGVYDDNISFSSSGAKGGYYFAIEPSIALGFGASGDEGNYIHFSYKPSFFVFVDHDEENSIQHIITLGAYHRFSRLALTLDQGIELLDGANLNTTTSWPEQSRNYRCRRPKPVNLYNTTLDATYDLTGKTFLSGGLGYSISDYRRALPVRHICPATYLSTTITVRSWSSAWGAPADTIGSMRPARIKHLSK